jgi:hypothetical protein
MAEHNQTLSCQFCGNRLTGKQTSYCSRRCKDKWWNQKRKAEIKGFETVASALKKAGFEVRRLPADQGPARAK